MSITKAVTTLVTIFLLGGMSHQEANAAETTVNNNLRNSNHNDVRDLEALDVGGERHLSTVYSYEYKYQKMKFCWKVFVPWYCYEDTDYRWCVEDTQNSCFPSTIGQNEFWDDDRIKMNNNGKTTACASRNDIGTGTCTKDSSYSDWTGTACSGKSFDLYQC